MTALKGGAGVTTLAAGLAQAAAHEGLKVVCIAADDEGLLKHHLGLVSLSDESDGKGGNPHITLTAGEDWRLGQDADVVLFDLTRSRPDLRDAITSGADAVVLVASTAASSLVQATSIKAILDQGENRFLLLNQDDVRIPLKKAVAAYLEDQFKDRVIGRVRQDEAVDEALASLEPLASAAPFSAAWNDMRSAFATLLNRMNSLQIAARPR